MRIQNPIIPHRKALEHPETQNHGKGLSGFVQALDKLPLSRLQTRPSNIRTTLEAGEGTEEKRKVLGTCNSPKKQQYIYQMQRGEGN